MRTPGPTKGTVLVVDDEVMLVRTYARGLGAAGYQVLTATDGRTAEALFRQSRVDAVVSDIGMPGMDGLALLRAIHGVDPAVPFILATGEDGDERARAAVRDGALMYLVKPVDMRTLGQIIGHATQSRRLPQPASLASSAAELLSKSVRAALGARFDAALQGLWIAYQPIVLWATCAVIAYEALVRTDEPTLAKPAALFAAAEALGRSTELGRAIRARVASEIPEAPEWARIFVNIGKEELSDDQLYGPHEPLRAHAGRVVLEITERASFDEATSLVTRVGALRAAGFRVAVDDLGAGYAGLSSIAHLKPSVVKLDISLVRGIGASAEQRQIVRALVQLCRDLSVDLVAEGVETGEERLALGFLGCLHHQGYAYARPQRGFAVVRAGTLPGTITLCRADEEPLS